MLDCGQGSRNLLLLLHHDGLQIRDCLLVLGCEILEFLGFALEILDFGLRKV